MSLTASLYCSGMVTAVSPSRLVDILINLKPLQSKYQIDVSTFYVSLVCKFHLLILKLEWRSRSLTHPDFCLRIASLASSGVHLLRDLRRRDLETMSRRQNSGSLYLEDRVTIGQRMRWTRFTWQTGHRDKASTRYQGSSSLARGGSLTRPVRGYSAQWGTGREHVHPHAPAPPVALYPCVYRTVTRTR